MTITKDGLQIRREIKAAPEKVFRAWTDNELLRRWFWPVECEGIAVEGNAKVGGKYRGSMICDGRTYTAFGIYREIVPNRKLVFTHQWEDADPVETLVTIELWETAEGTEIFFSQEGFTDLEEARSHEEGWESALDNLERILRVASHHRNGLNVNEK